MLLFQFWTLTVCRVISITSPFASYLGISIQSPSLTILFAVSWMPATNPSMESLKISEIIAVAAPIPLSIIQGERFIRKLMINMIPIIIEMISIT